MAEKYAAKHGLELNEVSYRDLGVSGFKRKNIEHGALAAFITAVKSGKIEKGSYLLVEQFDRLSRADVDVALRLLLDLVHSGVILVTLVDEKVWDKDAVKDIGNLILSIVFMSRANNESAMKAKRIEQAWDNKKVSAANGGGIITRECPRWLRVNAEGTAFEVLEDRVESVRRVFDMRINGHGVVSIVRRANLEQWPVPGKGASWHTSLVGRILKNRALLGEYQPHKGDGTEADKRIPFGDPIPNYYPVVIDETTFLKAAAVSERKGEFPGRRDINYRNWLQGLLKCTCGQSFVRKNKTSSKQPGYARYYCTARNRGASSCPSVSGKEIETAILSVISTVAPQFWQGSARVEELTTSVELLELDLTNAKQTRDRFVDAVGSSNAPIAALIQRLNEAEATVKDIEDRIRAGRAELADLAGDSDSVFENIAAAIRDVDSIDARAQLREDLSRVLDRCVVHATEGYVSVHMRGIDAPVVVPLNPEAALPGLPSEAPEGFGIGTWTEVR